MQVLYYKSPTGNFGDDLNALLWHNLLPAECFAPDDALLLGIGSIFRDDYLSPEVTHNKRVFVLGSGAGTGPLPRRWPNAEWSILAVRGPLTARLIDRPETAITDSAALLATSTRLLPEGEAAGDVLFFPHYNSVEFSRWPEVCKLTGMTFVDAHRPPEEILRMLGRARLVVTEAMHGAIVADTLRIPWIPVVCSPAILPFKWQDWTRSLDLPYRPHLLPPSSAWEALTHFKMRMTDRRQTRSSTVLERDDHLIADFHRRFGDVPAHALAPIPAVGHSTRTAVQKTIRLFDRIFIARAAEHLAATAQQPAFLSDDNIFSNRVERLQQAVQHLRRALGA